MPTTQATGSTARRLTALSLGGLLLFPLPAAAQPPQPQRQPILGRLLEPGTARVVVRAEFCRCGPPAAFQAALPGGDVLLLTIGTESGREDELHFHPLASLAFDRTLSQEGTGQWMAMWVYGPSPAGWRRTLRAVLPLPAGAPQASEKDLARLDNRLGEIRRAPADAALPVPDPVVQLINLGRASRRQGILGGLRRALAWANVVNPAQYLFRTYLSRRKDRRERNFQRAYLALQWLLDVAYTGEQEADWLGSVNELRFHLLRNRSFFGRWVLHADALELIYNYESSVRVKLGKASSWLQSAANEHTLRYQPFYRYTENGSAFPIGGVLYYDPRLGAAPDTDWWGVANPFDLPYNPHTHPEVQRLAREHPDELIPLSVYTFQTDLALRPIIAIDFFAPGNPGSRETNQQTMVMLKNWLAITTGALSPPLLSYRVIAWAANKKGFTRLVDKSSRLGIEELRLALEAELYFDPQLRPLLQQRADQRVLNPLIKPGPVEERLAHIQYESLLALDGRALCRTLARVREEMNQRLEVPDGLPPAEQRRDLARRLVAWNQQLHLEDFLAEPMGDFGSLAALREPLEFFLAAEPPDREELEDVLAELYAKLYIQQLRLPSGHSVPELEAALELTRRVWERVASRPDFAARQAKVEQHTRRREEKEQREREKRRRRALREFVESSHQQLKQARRAGCGAATDAPAQLDAHLVLLWEVLQAAQADENLRAEFQRHAPRLRRDLIRLEDALRGCPAGTDSWVADRTNSYLYLVRALQAELERASHNPGAQAAGGG
ncbi:MAG: hypothetical protein V3U28_07185 [Candidatus Acidoferrales bacterium]